MRFAFIALLFFTCCNKTDSDKDLTLTVRSDFSNAYLKIKQNGSIKADSVSAIHQIYSVSWNSVKSGTIFNVIFQAMRDSSHIDTGNVSITWNYGSIVQSKQELFFDTLTKSFSSSYDVR